MEIIIQPDAAQSARLVAAFIARAMRRKPDLVLGLATGSTPVPLYRELIRRHREDGLDFSRVTAFNLDEYLGIGPDHPGSYRRFMQVQLFDHINLSPGHTHLPDGLAPDVEAHCRHYEAQIRASGGIDIQVLGIGSDGHIGFNEPSSSLASRTRTKTLTSRTRRDNARFFENPADVPVECITMGIGTIMESRICLLLAAGERKAEAVAGALEGPITAMNPASALQLHPDTRVFLDEAAAGKLKMRAYYDEVFARDVFWNKLRQEDGRTL
ncbi:MAG: glucosamine-6-phosphate deaminase [Kiritimatiellae bacterium]|nr:glucosamine-6-phosphate deaminase [Kiritimatiellia bacterium]